MAFTTKLLVSQDSTWESDVKTYLDAATIVSDYNIVVDREGSTIYTYISFQ